MKVRTTFDPKKLRSWTPDGEATGGGGGEPDPKTEPDPDKKQEPDPKADTKPEPDPDDPKWDDSTKSYIAKLRKENASYRTRSKDLSKEVTDLRGEFDGFKKGIKKSLGMEDDEVSPEEKVTALTEALDEQVFRNHLMDRAIENGISKEGMEYFEFLTLKKGNDLEENESLTDDHWSEIIGEVKSKYNPVSGTTSTTGKKPDPDANPNLVTAESFKKLTMTEKTALYQKDPDLYNRMVTELKKTNKFI